MEEYVFYLMASHSSQRAAVPMHSRPRGFAGQRRRRSSIICTTTGDKKQRSRGNILVGCVVRKHIGFQAGFESEINVNQLSSPEGRHMASKEVEKNDK
jgi:hypothetical protein